MIKANELRIGNHIIGASREEVCIVTSGVIKAIDDGVANYLPIPLTPEVLERCGFERRKEEESRIIYGVLNFTIVYALTDENYYSYFLNGYHNDAEIKYLHQLQNLYFALTGEELPVINLMPENKNPVKVNS